MKQVQGEIVSSATDLANYTGCKHAVLLDSMLRAECFVDLHCLLCDTLLASVERSSLKDIDPFFGYERDMGLKEAGDVRPAESTV